MKDRITNASCSHCSVGKLLSSNAQVKETNIRNANASSIFVVPKTGNLKDHHFNLIVIPNGCLNDDIIHLKIKKIDPTLQGLQDAVLSSPVNSFLIRVMKSANKPFAGMLSETPAVVKPGLCDLTGQIQ